MMNINSCLICSNHVSSAAMHWHLLTVVLICSVNIHSGHGKGKGWCRWMQTGWAKFAKMSWISKMYGSCLTQLIVAVYSIILHLFSTNCVITPLLMTWSTFTPLDCCFKAVTVWHPIPFCWMFWHLVVCFHEMLYFMNLHCFYILIFFANCKYICSISFIFTVVRGYRYGSTSCFIKQYWHQHYSKHECW